MSSSPASESVFAAGCPLQVATGDHPLVAVVEPERAVVVSTPDGTVVAELGLREEAEGVDVAWLGMPPRLLVVSRFTEYTLVHLLDVTGEGGARMCAEKRVELPMRLFTVGGVHGLLAGANRAGIPSTAILTRTDDQIHIHPVAARGIPSAAGALGTQLVLAFAGMIEIWDPVDRVAKRRIKLPRPVQMSGVGGSDRQIWLTTITDPQRIEVIPLVNRGQPRAHELPETISSVASHPKLDVLVAAGADTGKLYVIDLDGRMPTRDLANERFGGRPMAMGLVGGRAPAIIAVASGQPPRAVWLDGSPVREWPPPPEPPKVHFEPTLPDIAAIPRLSTAASSPAIAIPTAAPARSAPAPAAAAPPAPPAAPPTVFDSMLGHSVVDPGAAGHPAASDARGNISNAATRIQRTPRPPRDEPAPPVSHADAAPPRPPTLAERLEAWRERVGEASAHTPPLAEPASAGPAAPPLQPAAPSASTAPSNADPVSAETPRSDLGSTSITTSASEPPDGVTDEDSSASARPLASALHPSLDATTDATTSVSAETQRSNLRPSTSITTSAGEPPAGVTDAGSSVSTRPPIDDAAISVSAETPASEPSNFTSITTSASTPAAHPSTTGQGPSAGSALSDPSLPSRPTSRGDSGDVFSPASAEVSAETPPLMDLPDHALFPQSARDPGKNDRDMDGRAPASASTATAPMITTPRAPTEPGVVPWSASASGPVTDSSEHAPSAPSAVSAYAATPQAPPPGSTVSPYAATPQAPPPSLPPQLASTPSDLPPKLTGTPPPRPLLPPEPPAWFVPSPPAPVAAPPATEPSPAARASTVTVATFPSSAAAGHDWRRALIEWARAMARGQGGPLALAPPFTSILARLTLGAQLGPALQMLYACHLAGHREVPPADVAAALTGLDPEARWREALGAGVLGDLGLVTLRGSNLRLCGPALRVLDDRPPRYGVVVGRGKGFPRDRSAAIVIDGADPSLTPLQLAEAAAALAATPVLAVTRALGSLDDLRAASLEARLRGALAAISFPWPLPLPTSAPALYLAPTREEAESTSFEVLIL